MTTAFPSGLDALNNPAATGHYLNTAGVTHSSQHSDANDAIEALEAKVGVDGSAVATSLDYLVKKGAAWTPFAPVLSQSGTVTATVMYSRYTRIGRTITYQGLLAVTGTGTAVTAVVVSLPVAAAQAGNMSIGSGFVFDLSVTTNYAGLAVANATTTMAFVPTTNNSGTFLGVSGGFSAALASGDAVTWSVTYEAAS